MSGGLAGARILICNDDGIEAEGIRVLEQAALRLSDDVWVVAPSCEQSGTAHSFTANGILTAERRAERRFAVSGTPTDCILYACNVLLKDHRPDFIFSGVNHGANLGLDVVYSGTAGAAIEGALQGIKSFAFSLFGAKKSTEFWPMVLELLPDIVNRFALQPWEPYTFLNVNFPECLLSEVTGIELTQLSHRKIGDAVEVLEQTDSRCTFKIGYARTGIIPPKSDTDAILRGSVSVTPVCLRLTDNEQMAAFQSIYS